MFCIFEQIKKLFSIKSKEGHMKTGIDKIAKVNWELDTNKKLRDSLYTLAQRYNISTENEYIERYLNLLGQEGIFLTKDELKKLLILRRQTDKMLQEEKLDQDILAKANEKQKSEK